MTSEYNKLLFTNENTDFKLINYYMSNEDKNNPFIKYLPKNAVSQDIINTPIYQEIHTGYNPYSKSMKSLDISNNNNIINEYKTKSEYINIDSPDIIDCEITMEDDFCLNKGNNNNIINDYKFYSKSPKCNKNINSIHFDDLSFYSTNKNQNQNKARSPKIVRKNYFKLDKDDDLYNFNDNNDLVFQSSNPLSKSYARSPSPSIINANTNINILKDSFSTNNIHPINNFQYQNNINSFQKKNLYKKQMSISPPNKQYIALSNYKNKNQIDINSNDFTSSTKYSRSPNLKKYNYSNNLLSKSITGFPNNINTNNNNNLAYTSSNVNLENYKYLIDNPVPNTFNSVLNTPDSDANDNINNIYNNSQFNYLINNRDNNSKNIILTPSKLNKTKFPKSNINNNQYIQKYTLSPFPKNVNTFINTNNNNNSSNAYSNHQKTIYQYNFQKSLSPKNIQYQAGNNLISTNSKKIKNENILNSNNKYNPNIKSSLPKISNFSKDISKKEFLSNNINDISFGDSNNIQNSVKNIKIFGISSQKSITGENSISLRNDFKQKNFKKSNKLSNNQNEFSDINFNKSTVDTLKTKNKFPKKVANKKSFNYFCKFMFESINKIRANPQSFIMNLKNAINNIAYDKKGNLYYNGNIKVALSKGKLAFEEAISFLEKARPMKPLIHKKELCVEIPEKQKDFKSGDYLRKKINKMVMKGISVRAFWRDIIKDPQINFLLMIVDDNFIRRGAKRKDILNPDMKYIGINSANMGDNFVCYTVLSDE